MNPRFKKIGLLFLAAAMLFGAGRLQQSMNRDRQELGLTRTAVLQNAPPGLAFTTVALGGFRGLISNFLWIRANNLQQDDKFFEASQLADWITELEPTYAQVWVFQAWNMAYNISVKFKENSPGVYTDRWHWLQRGIELLRDDGLRYNPNSILIYRELGWFFQHKMGQDLDDANMYYKYRWSEEMKGFFGPKGTNFDQLLSPKTADDFKRLEIFTNKFKLDPAFVVQVNDKYGPFDWRLPEAHAIYWAAKGLDAVAKNPDKVKSEDIIMLRRITYQSLLQSFHHGRLVYDPVNKTFLGPNLDIVGRVNQIYLDSADEETDQGQKNNILGAHRNFLRDAIYFLYEAGRTSEANKWFKYLGEKYPDKPIVENEPDSLPKNLSLDEYAVKVIQIDIGETSKERVMAALSGLLRHAYVALAMDDDDRSTNLKNLAQKVYDHYNHKTISAKSNDRIELPPFDIIQKMVVQDLLNPERQVLPYEGRAILRTRLGLPPETATSPAAATNNVEIISTNLPATNLVVPAIP